MTYYEFLLNNNLLDESIEIMNNLDYRVDFDPDNDDDMEKFFLKLREDKYQNILVQIQLYHRLNDVQSKILADTLNNLNSMYVIGSWNVSHSKHVSFSHNINNSSFVQNSKEIYQSSYIYGSKDISNSSTVYYSDVVSNSHAIANSKNILFSKQINYSSNVLHSKNISNSNTIMHGSDIIYGKNIENSSYCVNSNNLKNCYFCSSLNDAENCVFNKSVPTVTIDFVKTLVEEKKNENVTDLVWQEVNQYSSGYQINSVENPFIIYKDLDDDFINFVKSLPFYSPEIAISIFHNLKFC